MSNIKKLISGVLALFVFAVPAVTMAATLTDDGLGVNAVSNFTRNPNTNNNWRASETAAPGDIVSFGVYYANRTNETVHNVVVRLSTPQGGTNTSYTLTGTVSGSNAAAISGPATVTISSPQTLTWNGTVNVARNTTGNGTPVSNGSSLFGSGIVIGDVGPGEFGTVVARFAVGNEQQQVVTEPTVQTNGPTNIGQNSCTLNGFVNTQGNSNVTTFFQFGSTSSFGQTAGTQTISSSQNISTTISGLGSNSTTFYRAVAQRSGGPQVFGATQTCTTQAAAQVEPTVQTNQPTNIQSNQATLNGFVNTNGNSNVNVFFEFGQTSNFGQTLGFQTVNGSQNISFTNFNLSPNTTYFYRAVAQRSGGPQVFGATVSFTTPGIGANSNEPTVQTNSPTNIGQNSCTLNGFVNTNGNSNVNVFFEFGQTSNFGQTLGFQTVNGSQNISFTNFNLSPNTTYFYRAVAQRNGGPQVFGNIVTCTTGSSFNQVNPTAQTLPATRTSVATTWILNGLLSNNNSNQFSSVFFEYGESTALGNRTSSQSLFNGSFSATLPNLIPGRTYFFRAVAQANNGAISQGQILSFTVDGNFNNGQATDITTLPATNRTSSSLQLNGQVVNSGTCQALTGFFEFGQTTSLGNQTPVQTIAAGSSATFFRVIQNLSAGTTYFFRAVAQDSCGNIVRGNILSATTLGGVANPVPPPPSPTPQVVVQSPFILSFGYAPLRPLPGTEVTYRIGWKNDSGIRLNDALLRVTLPEGITFLSTESGLIRDGEKNLLRPIGNVARGASDAYTFRARIESNVPIASDPAMGIQMSFFNPNTGANGSVSIKGITRIGDGTSENSATTGGPTIVVNNTQPEVVVVETPTNNTPNATGLAFLGGLGAAFPKTVIGWVLLILALALLLAVIRHYFIADNRPKA